MSDTRTNRRALLWGLVGLVGTGAFVAATTIGGQRVDIADAAPMIGGGLEEPRLAPAATVKSAPASGLQKAVLAGGCFWGVQAVFQHTKGVTRSVSGYAGGTKATAVYETVGTGKTGHAEAVEVTFDPKVITYEEILRIFFSVATDPTQVGGQFPDAGPQYRNAIFPMNADQKRVAEAYIAQLNRAKTYPKTLATKVEPAAPFYPAEPYHQDYLINHPNEPYIRIYDQPKLVALKRYFPNYYRDRPVLVAARK